MNFNQVKIAALAALLVCVCLDLNAAVFGFLETDDEAHPNPLCDHIFGQQLVPLLNKNTFRTKYLAAFSNAAWNGVPAYASSGSYFSFETQGLAFYLKLELKNSASRDFELSQFKLIYQPENPNTPSLIRNTFGNAPRVINLDHIESFSGLDDIDLVNNRARDCHIWFKNMPQVISISPISGHVKFSQSGEYKNPLQDLYMRFKDSFANRNNTMAGFWFRSEHVSKVNDWVKDF